ncbi:response regulator [Alkaliphilus pronyensis]|uniref:Stage 0 sporulation protein A homolog n=1 Tax=Alkaliphilus pronyensis TaxID=1482732 RepID=A0A6I0EZU9_9FIRM|nr:response regulator [Alkaliphilus pronyensis]KAB3534847.1 response regulator [Alkaliphilus pronyensis]
MKRKVLIVNDSKFEAIVLFDLLSKLGYDVKIADEYNALDIVEAYQPNYIFVNYIMVDTTGDRLINKIKEKFPNANCYLSSSNEINYQKFNKVDGIIHTPVTIKNLVGMIESHMKEPLCKNCNNQIEETFLHCPYCGEKIQ